ncbi:hypothetical protein B9Z55_007548 [Caenorhabditis nigoni]|nr:hypothetical protein B9Z55_007548 [Caenorhabditis nigoni]
MEDGVFAMDLVDATYIATTHTHYWLHSNGSKPTYGEVPRSGHFLFTAPHDTMLEIGGQKFHGRHDTLKLHPIRLTYGETTSEQLQDILDRLGVKENDVFMDLGSGIG